MKRVLVALTYFNPNVSGVTVYADILSRELTNNRFSVSILCSQHKKHLAKEENIGTTRVVRCPVWFSVGKGVVMPGYVWRAWREVKGVDVINCHLPQLESCVLALIARLQRKPLVVTHHCEFGFSGPWANRVAAFLSFPFHIITYLLADKIVSYTQDYAQHSLFLRHFLAKTTFILPPVVVNTQSKGRIHKLKSQIHKNHNTKVIGFVGRLGWEKGINYLIEAVASINQKYELKVVLVGPYEDVVGDKSFQKLKPLIEKHKDWIVLTGPLPHDEIANFFALCDCLVLPSTNNLETFGIVQAEAMVSGVPVVASDLPGVRVPVRLTKMGQIAKVGDSVDLAQKISKVLATNYPPSFTKNAKRIFSLSTFSQKYKELFFLKY